MYVLFILLFDRLLCLVDIKRNCISWTYRRVKSAFKSLHVPKPVMCIGMLIVYTRRISVITNIVIRVCVLREYSNTEIRFCTVRFTWKTGFYYLFRCAGCRTNRVFYIPFVFFFFLCFYSFLALSFKSVVRIKRLDLYTDTSRIIRTVTRRKYRARRRHERN